MGIYLCRICDNRVLKKGMKFIYFLCFFIGMMNMGLWFCDIIGKENFIYKFDEEFIWKFCKFFSLLFLIFYCF